MPVASVVGGIAAQEAMKALTHHMTPLKQWLYADHVDLLPGDWTAFENAKLSADDCKPVYFFLLFLRHVGTFRQLLNFLKN